MIGKILFLSLACLASAGVPYGRPVYDSYEPVYEGGPEPYNFAYDVKDEYGNTLLRQEQGDELGNKKGSYGYVDAYGISRQVDYVADDKGFRAVVKTNEPGTDNQNPADVEIISSAAPSAYASGYGSGSLPASSLSRQSLYPAYGQPIQSIGGPALVSRQPLRQAYSAPSPIGVSSSSYGVVPPVPAVY